MKAKRDWAGMGYRPRGTTRVRSYICYFDGDSVDEARKLVADDAAAMADEIRASGFEAEARAPELSGLPYGGLRVEAVVVVRGRFDWDDHADYDRFSAVFRKLQKDGHWEPPR